MKVRESGMPDEKTWEKFFDLQLLLSEMEINSEVDNLVEIGIGYGTFTIPAAKQIKGMLYGFDIEAEMLDTVKQKITKEQLDTVILEQRDILTQTTGLPENSIDYVMLFNILHHDSPNDFLDEAFRILKSKGKIGIIHWRSDIVTPRGPDLSIRPKPDQIIKWIDSCKFNINKHAFIIEPYHYGVIISKR
jgi:ubiquinone/menaquinone biosynthesis C-methylase UbiE